MDEPILIIATYYEPGDLLDVINAEHAWHVGTG